MRLIKPMVIVEDDLDMLMPNGVTLAQHMMKKIELFTRKCYKSEGRMGPDTYKKFIPAIFGTRGHKGMAEHRVISVTFISDRGISLTTVKDADLLVEDWCGFLNDLAIDDMRYKSWRERGWTPEKARYWLPQGTKTEYAASLNLGSWYNFFVKRTAPDAHPQMRQLAIPLLRYFQQRLGEFFDSITLPAAVFDPYTFQHKDALYEEAKLVVNPFYDQVPFDVVYQD